MTDFFGFCTSLKMTGVIKLRGGEYRNIKDQDLITCNVGAFKQQMQFDNIQINEDGRGYMHRSKGGLFGAISSSGLG